MSGHSSEMQRTSSGGPYRDAWRRLDVHFQSCLFDGGVQVEGGFIVRVEVEVE